MIIITAVLTACLPAAEVEKDTATARGRLILAATAFDPGEATYNS